MHWKGSKALISEIEYPNGVKVKFNYATSGHINVLPVLRNIKVEQGYDNNVKTTITYNLISAFFNSAGGETAYPGSSSQYPNYGVTHRLKLTSIEKTSTSKNGVMTEPIYSFEYDNTNLPERLSFSQDIYGYYNGKAVTPFQGTALAVPYHTGTTGVAYGVDKNSDFSYAKANILTEVIKGDQSSIEFYYDGHYLTNVDTIPNLLTGGVTIRHQDPDLFGLNTCDGIRLYSVLERDGYSNYILTTLNYSEGQRFWKGGFFHHQGFGNQGFLWFNNMVCDYEPLNGAAHGYGKIRVTKANQDVEILSEEEYRFVNVFTDNSFMCNQNSLSYLTATGTPITTPNDPYGSYNRMATRIIRGKYLGLLREKKTFGSNSNLLKKDNYYYEESFYLANGTRWRLSHVLQEGYLSGKTKSTLYTYGYDDPFTDNYAVDELDLVTSIKWTDSKGVVNERKFDYLEYGVLDCFQELHCIHKNGSLYAKSVKIGGVVGMQNPHFFNKIYNSKFTSLYQIPSNPYGYPISSSVLKSKEYTLWDPWNNILETHYDDIDEYEACIWDTRIAEKVAVADNAKYSQIAFTSFEGSFAANGTQDYNKGNWDFFPAEIIYYNGSGLVPKTGRYYYNLLPGKAISSNYPLESGKDYIVTFWTNTYGVIVSGATIVNSSNGFNIGGWTLRTYRLRGQNSPVTISTNSVAGIKVDELRMHPYDASMVTKTFEPLIGPSSVTDERNSTTYFEYDPMGRLTLTKDFQGNIISQTQTVVNGIDY